jgi:hypothetical protein
MHLIFIAGNLIERENKAGIFTETGSVRDAPDTDLRATEVLEDGKTFARLNGRFTDRADTDRVFVVSAVREVEAGDIHSGGR